MRIASVTCPSRRKNLATSGARPRWIRGRSPFTKEFPAIIFSFVSRGNTRTRSGGITTTRARTKGIGFYAEEMMLQAGLFDDSPHTREIIYNFMRLRALRVEVDVKLALGEFTLEQAAKYLQEKVPMDEQTARQEAIAFSTGPGQAITYQIGKLQIMKFLADARMQQGEKFNLRAFHDFVWKNGNVPIALQEWEYLHHCHSRGMPMARIFEALRPDQATTSARRASATSRSPTCRRGGVRPRRRTPLHRGRRRTSGGLPHGHGDASELDRPVRTERSFDAIKLKPAPEVTDEAARSTVLFHPVACTSPEAPARDRFAPELIAYHQPDHPVSQQYRQLLSAITEHWPAGAARVLLFSGGVIEADTTLVLLNLAITGARNRCVSPWWMRRPDPGMAGYLGLPTAPGLSEVLTGAIPLQRCLQKTGQAKLVALTAGDTGGRSWLAVKSLKTTLSQCANASIWCWLQLRPG